jgi:dTDP-glucose pyrophosphorylase
MTATRAVVLARGLGTRMRTADPTAPLTEAQRHAADAGMKAMMPIHGRPFLDFVLSEIADAAIHQVALVVAPDHEELRRYYEVIAPPSRIHLEFVVQAEALGTANAVIAAESWVSGAAFLVMNSDNVYPARVLRELAALEGPGLSAFDPGELVQSSNIDPSRVRAFALVDVNGDGDLAGIVEKPSRDEMERAGAGARVSMNCWRFDDRIFAACRDVARSPRGEYELPVAVALALQRGVRFTVLAAHGPVLDLSQRADAAEVARRLSAVRPQP